MAAAVRQSEDQKAALVFWRRLVRQALRKSPTPLYLFSAEPAAKALTELDVIDEALPVPVRHWLSCKTQPVPPLLRWWRRQGRGIEVVSEFEFLAARHEGYAPDQILINGPAKQRWLPRYPVENLRVNFDSMAEMRALLPQARKSHWSVGVRCQTREEFDPENPGFPTQFGMMSEEASQALKHLNRAGLHLDTIHFHLRTNVASPDIYERAAREIAGICRNAGVSPKHVDCGGGIPPHHVLAPNGPPFDRRFDLARLARNYARAVALFPGLEELWLENGRFLLAGSGVLVVRVLEVKQRPRLRQLICDGGRTTNALISTWEAHRMLIEPPRYGPLEPTVVCGPTCMAFDQLAHRPSPNNIRPGDYLIWMDAGAYHIPWETHFSHGLAAVFWHKGDSLELVRPAESFETWWGRWKSP
jgi:diaminopimelate decarboxylase